MIKDQYIPCPVCQTNIPFDTNELIRGRKFSCPQCDAIVGITQESVGEVENALKMYNNFKTAVRSKKK